MPVQQRPLKKLVTKATRKALRFRWPPEPLRVQAILRELDGLYPKADCELHHENPFQLLCATILSAQCTDERVNQVVAKLFARFPTPGAMAEAPLPVLEDLIRSTGFYRQKAKNLKATGALLTELHGGEVPRTIDEIRNLPGAA